MDEKEVYNLLDNGWIYCLFKDNYFEKVILGKIKKNTMIIDNKIFIKKSKKLYKLLKAVGMDMSTYDSVVVIVFRKFNTDLKIDFISISNTESLEMIAKRIVLNDDF